MFRLLRRRAVGHRCFGPFARGFSTFGATRGSFDAFLRVCRNIGLDVDTVVASRDPADSPGRIRHGRPLAVFQDILPGSPLLPSLVRDVIFPAWFDGIPICLFSRAARGEYSVHRALSGSLHTDVGAVEEFLSREQMIRILELADVHTLTPSFPSPVSPNGASQRIPLDADMDASQSAAAAHGAGPMRLLAPAGSGKTKTIVNRVCTLVNTGVEPGSILPLAFNRKAAEEMNIRLGGKSLGGVAARTFHSLGYEIVRRGSLLRFDAGGESALTGELVKEVFRDVHPEVPQTGVKRIEHLSRLLSRAKMDLLPLEALDVDTDCGSVPFGPVFSRFLEVQTERGIMNYDDMIYFAVRILLDDDALRREYQERFGYILVDEFQDLNRAQMLLLRILALPENNLFVVGDDDQLIYGWRGAEVRGMLDFPRVNARARESSLSTNYRSAQRIVAHAGWLISRNSERVAKTVVPRSGAPVGGFDIVLRTGLWNQARSAAQWISGNDRPACWHDTAVLFRYNAIQFPVALALDALGIPHTSAADGVLFASRAGKDVAAWFNVLLFPGRAVQSDIRRVLRRPERILTRARIDRVESWSDLELLPGSGSLTEVEEDSLQRFLVRIEKLRIITRSHSSSGLIGQIDRSVRLRMSYADRGPATFDPDEPDDLTCLEVIVAVSETYSTPADFLAHIEASRAGTPGEQLPHSPPGGRDEVILSTIHRAKGREFKRVVLFDLSRRRRPVPVELEEERRVAYVALTRAKDALLITADRRRQSRFLREAALDPQFSGRMREDLESELRGCLKRCRRMIAAGGSAHLRNAADLRRNIDALREELRCRAMLSLPAVDSLKE
jgi:DNA helicase-2/ATP-dependent DNA helicase PcrA